jgi:hypothetical protein
MRVLILWSGVAVVLIVFKLSSQGLKLVWPVVDRCPIDIILPKNLKIIYLKLLVLKYIWKRKMRSGIAKHSFLVGKCFISSGGSTARDLRVERATRVRARKGKRMRGRAHPRCLLFPIFSVKYSHPPIFPSLVSSPAAASSSALTSSVRTRLPPLLLRPRHKPAVSLLGP